MSRKENAIRGRTYASCALELYSLAKKRKRKQIKNRELYNLLNNIYMQVRCCNTASDVRTYAVSGALADIVGALQIESSRIRLPAHLFTWLIAMMVDLHNQWCPRRGARPKYGDSVYGFFNGYAPRRFHCPCRYDSMDDIPSRLQYMWRESSDRLHGLPTTRDAIYL